MGHKVGDFDLNLRYNQGLSNTAKDSGSLSFPNQVLQLSPGLRFEND